MAINISAISTALTCAYWLFHLSRWMDGFYLSLVLLIFILIVIALNLETSLRTVVILTGCSPPPHEHVMLPPHTHPTPAYLGIYCLSEDPGSKGLVPWVSWLESVGTSGRSVERSSGLWSDAFTVGLGSPAHQSVSLCFRSGSELLTLLYSFHLFRPIFTPKAPRNVSNLSWARISRIVRYVSILSL